MADIITIENFGKSYGNVRAVDGLSLAIREGELFGMIGPDGAGKTTTMRTLCTLLPLEEGRMQIDGHDVRTNIISIRSILGYMPQRFSLYPDLSVEQNLTFFADLFGVPPAEKRKRLARLYHFSKLEPFKNRLAKQLSGGMKQKLALSCTLIHTPKILILDEPTTGVDPVSRREFWQILRQLRDEGVTILISTPYMDEALLCNRVAFMHKGRLLALDDPRFITKNFPYMLYEVAASNPQLLVPYFKKEMPSKSVHVFGDCLHVSFEAMLANDVINRIVQHAPQPIAAMRQIEPGIEDTFMVLMKEEVAF
ncbi:MAG: ABC transporter ATP-binding protein [candidate division KSB1 bacterium]|nr:ABC transporter ATP-binding protein [candidate division KSB1 bacterium]MDZ7302338.1 ABC transporter ATP-binding protein [candidate division KSB1 bacterium]MDZ7311191.1 ABC transporter ATP-binding protein [candidate division KSB1 bacterium]